MLSKHRFMNALIRNKSLSYNLARYAANNGTKDGLAQSILSNHTQYSWQNERNVNTFTRRLFSSDSNEVCANGKCFNFPFFSFKNQLLKYRIFFSPLAVLSRSLSVYILHIFIFLFWFCCKKKNSESHSQLYPSRKVENMLFTI